MKICLGSYIRYIILPEDLVLEALLIDDTPKAKPKRERTGLYSNTFENSLK